MAYGFMASLRGLNERFSKADGWFFETDLALAKADMAGMLALLAKDRITGLIGIVGGGVNIEGALERGTVVARQTAIVAAMVRDTKSMIAEVAADRSLIGEAEEACKGRLELNETRIRAVMGAN
jgi:hypothetical protein